MMNFLYLAHILLALPVLGQKSNLTSSKRGLVYIYTGDGDDSIWDSGNSDLTWYYNYAMDPTDGISNLQFVPMLWGVGDQYTGFASTVQSLMSGGRNIPYVLGFNEPDLCGHGGSCVDPSTAARVWKQEIEPLKQHGVRLGAPATSDGGLSWYQEFLTACNGECTIDFLPIHYYGDFDGLAGYVGLVHETYPNMSSIWVTEFADENVTLAETKSFFNDTLDYLDNLTYITHYSYFGTFRSQYSNVGPNAAMLDRGGHLTDIGAWYLGQNATGYGPRSGSPSAASLSPWLMVFIAMTVLVFWLG